MNSTRSLANFLLVLATLTVEESAAVTVTFRKSEDCKFPGDHFQLTCLLKSAPGKENPINFYRGGTMIVDDTEKFVIDPKSPRCRNDSARGIVWDLEVVLTVHDVSPSDAGTYTCKAEGTGKQADTSVRVITGNELSASEKTLQLGHMYNLSLTRECELPQAVKVFKTNGNGGLTAVFPHHSKDDRYQDPYVRLEDGWFIIPKFDCELQGTYVRQVSAIRDFQLTVIRTHNLTLKACDECCKIVDQTKPVTVGNKTEPTPSGLSSSCPTTILVVLLVVFTILFISAFLLCVHLYRKNCRLERINRSGGRGP